jgi:CRISPR-associated endonuclease/helicase Cas3
MNVPEHISHIYQNPMTGQWVFQSNEAHTEGVARLASSFAGKFGMAEWGKAIALLHDKGKESNAFQQHIKRNSGYGLTIKVVGDYHHAFVGAKIAEKIYGKSAENLLVNQIYSHHTGLHDCGDMQDLQKDIPAEVDAHVQRCNLNKLPFAIDGNDFHHLSRMLFSCLVDADFLDTEAFMDAESHKLRGRGESLQVLEGKLDAFLARLKESAKDTAVNRTRAQVQQCCLDSARSPKGFYSLTVPTGGGKTLSSLLWAVKHALHNGQKRIIIAIPYTSIIVQTASILKSIFGEENVLEHHSNVDPEQIKDEKLRRKMSMAAENWDAPIIVTTNVQLFESMFSNRPSACRKLHNIVNSVIILDEVQTLPIDFLQPIVDSLKTYQKIFGVSILFTTASQPVLSGLIKGCNPKASFNGIVSIKEIIPSEYALHDKLRRVQLDINNGPQSYDEVAEQLMKHPRVLCIVNTRRDAKEIFSRLPQEGVTLHLSRMMCPRHVSETIARIKQALKDDANTIIRVVATQLVEAGVDIDFPVVYRQEIGLDSLLQAAGRCNREGRLEMCTTHMFSLAKEHALPSGMMQDSNNARLALDSSSDWFSPKVMTQYFQQLYCRVDSFDAKDIKHYLYNIKELYFDTAAKKFHLIDDAGVSVIVAWKDSPGLIERFKSEGPSYALTKKLGQYTVNIYMNDFKALLAMGVIKEIYDGVYVMGYSQQYDERLGLVTDNKLKDETIII